MTRRKHILCARLLSVLAVQVLLSPVVVAQEKTVLQVAHTASRDPYFIKQERYFVELIKLALTESEENYSTRSVLLPPHNDSRSVNFIKHNTYSIHWMNTSDYLEESLLPIRIPLYKGLIGWRAFFIHKSQVSRFEKIRTLGELKREVAVQGHDWPDTTILRKNGFTVETGADFENLFSMLERGRADFFPRSILEIWNEQDAHSSMDIVVDKNTVMHYPAAFYFFVHKDNVRLRNAIEKGLNKAIANGSFDEMFYRYFGELLLRANLQEVRVFEMLNPELPLRTPLERSELWFSTDELTQKK